MRCWGGRNTRLDRSAVLAIAEFRHCGLPDLPRVERTAFLVLTPHNETDVASAIRTLPRLRPGKLPGIRTDRDPANEDLLSLMIFATDHQTCPEPVLAAAQEHALALRFFDSRGVDDLLGRHAELRERFLASPATRIEKLEAELRQSEMLAHSLRHEVDAYRKYANEMNDLRRRAVTNQEWRSLFGDLAHKITGKVTLIGREIERLNGDEHTLDDVTKKIVIDAARDIQERLVGLERRRFERTLDLQTTELTTFIEALRDLAAQNRVAAHLPRRLDGRIEIDRTKVLDAIQELFTNAHQWADGVNPGRPPQIDVDARKIFETVADRPMLEMVVTDDGPGVEEAVKSAIFLPTITFRRDGTGMGLAEVQFVCESHGGYAFENGIPDRGARFVMRLPMLSSDRTEENAS